MPISNTHPISWQKISDKVEQQFPDFLRTEGPLLVAFMKAYYEWMDDTSNQNYALRNLRNWRDVDRSLDRFTDWFHNEFMIRIPKDIQVDRTLLIKHVQTFYRAKGTQQAYRLLFRILYNEEIDFYYPGQDLFRYNATPWVIDKSLKTDALVATDVLYECLGKEITGSTSGARARIEKIEKTLAGGVHIFEIFVAKIISGPFVDNEFLVHDSVNIAKVRTGGVITYPGRYLKQTGWNSIEHYQDSYYWQEYSYEIKSATPISTYRDIIKDLVHPAGTKLFGSTVIEVITGDPENLTPLVSIEYGETSAINEILELFSILFPLAAASMATSVAIDGLTSPIAGHGRVANSELISVYAGYPLSAFSSWEINNFTDGKGLLGTGTTWSANLSGVNTIRLKDPGGIYGNGTFMLSSADSANTMSVGPAYYSLAGNNLLVFAY